MIGACLLACAPAIMVLAASQNPVVSIPWLSYVQSGGVIAVMLGIFWFIITGRLVTGREFNEMKAERDFYRNLTTNSTSMQDRSVNALERLAEKDRVENIELREELLKLRRGKDGRQE